MSIRRRPLSPEERLIVALDVDNLKTAEALVERLSPAVKTYKIGAELFTVAGTEAVKMVQSRGGKVFLDLKYHDIPNTVARSSAAAVELGVFMFNLHAAGGREMMRRAVESVNEKVKATGIPRPLLVGVTVLTSVDDNSIRETGVVRTVKAQVAFLVVQALEAGLDGVVASGEEIGLVRRQAGEDFIIVVPGMRPKGVDTGDQKRIMTPGEAVSRGADYLVVGRPITTAPDPRLAAEAIIEEIRKGGGG